MEKQLESGMANQEVNKLAGDVGIPSGADGAIDKEVDQGMQGNLGGNNQGGGGGQAADGMINQEVDKFAGEAGVPSGADGAINSAVDKEVNQFI